MGACRSQGEGSAARTAASYTESVRLAVYADLLYWQDGDTVSTSTAFVSWLGGLSDHVDEPHRVRSHPSRARSRGPQTRWQQHQVCASALLREPSPSRRSGSRDNALCDTLAAGTRPVRCSAAVRSTPLCRRVRTAGAVRPRTRGRRGTSGLPPVPRTPRQRLAATSSRDGRARSRIASQAPGPERRSCSGRSRDGRPLHEWPHTGTDDWRLLGATCRSRPTGRCAL